MAEIGALPDSDAQAAIALIRLPVGVTQFGVLGAAIDEAWPGATVSQPEGCDWLVVRPAVQTVPDEGN